MVDKKASRMVGLRDFCKFGRLLNRNAENHSSGRGVGSGVKVGSGVGVLAASTSA